MKTEELRQKSVEELQTEIKELQKAHFNLRMQKGTQQLANSSQLGNTRRAISRAKTVLGQKQAAAQQG